MALSITATTTATTTAPTVSATHNFVSTKADPADTTIVGKTKWNDNHNVSVGTPATTATTSVSIVCASGVVLGNVSGSAGAIAEVTPSQLFDAINSTNGAILTRISGTWGAAANVAIDSGDLNLKPNASPTTPTSGVKLVGASLGGKPSLGVVDTNGRLSPMQQALHRVRRGSWLPLGNTSANPIGDGLPGPSNAGTVTGRNVASSSMAAGARRIGYVSAGTGGSASGCYMTAAQFFRGGVAAAGGWLASFRWTWVDGASLTTANMFAGFSSSISAPTDVAPSSLANIIGVGCDTGDTQLQLYAAGSAAQTRTALGSSFPCVGGTGNTEAYDLITFCPPNASFVTWQVVRLSTGDTAGGTITLTAALPAATQLLAPRLWRSNGGSGVAVGIDLISFYVETEV